MGFRVVTMLLFAALCSGCMTVLTKNAGELGLPYSGAGCDAQFLGSIFGDAATEPTLLFLAIPALIDLPLSAVADTVLLPIDLATTPKDSRCDFRT